MSLHECIGRLEKQRDLVRISRHVDRAPRELQFALATRVQGDRDIIANEPDPIQPWRWLSPSPGPSRAPRACASRTCR